MAPRGDVHPVSCAGYRHRLTLKLGVLFFLLTALLAVCGETQAGQRIIAFLDSLHRRAVAAHAANEASESLFMQGEAPPRLGRVRGSGVNFDCVAIRRLLFKLVFIENAFQWSGQYDRHRPAWVWRIGLPSEILHSLTTRDGPPQNARGSWSRIWRHGFFNWNPFTTEHRRPRRMSFLFVEDLLFEPLVLGVLLVRSVRHFFQPAAGFNSSSVVQGSGITTTLLGLISRSGVLSFKLRPLVIVTRGPTKFGSRYSLSRNREMASPLKASARHQPVSFRCKSFIASPSPQLICS